MKKLILLIILILGIIGCSRNFGEVKTTTAEFEVGGNRVVVNELIFGAKGDSKFKPEAKLTKWNEEEDLIVSVDDELEDKAIQKGDKLVSKSKDGKREYHFYTKTAEELGSEDDGFEYELILNEKPDTNIFTWQLENWEDLDFYYQPTLTEEEINEGRIRPEHIIGSYAVYHKTKKDNQYKTGKLFHIYRPKIIDKNKDWIWGEMNIEDGVLTIIVNNDWLEKAKYPVSIDPTFGYTSIAASTASYGADRIYAVLFPLAEAGTPDSLHWYGKRNLTGTGHWSMAIYDDDGSSGDPGTLLAETPEANYTQTIEWHSENISGSPSLMNSGDYYIALWSYETWYLYYDDGESGPNVFKNSLYTLGSPNWPDPLGTKDDSYSEILSIYCTYTGGVSPPTLLTATSTSILQTSATLNGEVTATNTAENFAIGFEYGVDAFGGDFTATTTVESATSSIGVYFDEVTGLTTFEEYGFRSYASTTDGSLNYGDTYQFFTGDISTSTPVVVTDKHAWDNSSWADGTYATTTDNAGSLEISGSAGGDLTIESGDCTQSGTNVTDQTFDMTIPAYSDGDLIVLNISVWQDNNDTQSMSFPAGPNSETITAIDDDYGGSGNADLPVIGIGWFIGDGSYAGGTITITSGDATARWDAAAILVPAGEFDATTPISANDTQDNSGISDVTDIDMPTFSAASNDGGGKLIVFGGSDQDPWSNTPPSGYTELVEHDMGREAIGLWGRDSAVTNSESIAAATFDLAGAAADALAIYGYIIRTVQSSLEEGYWIGPSWDVGSIDNVDTSWLEVASTTPDDSLVDIAVALNTSASVAPAIDEFATTTNLSAMTGVTGDLTGKYLWTLVWLHPNTDEDDTPSVTQVIWAINQSSSPAQDKPDSGDVWIKSGVLHIKSEKMRIK